MTKTLSHIVLALIVFIWVVPFVALVSTSMRSEVAAKTSGFWTSFTPTELGHRFATHERGVMEPAVIMRGNILERINAEASGYAVSGDVKSILIKTRIADPENPGKTKLVRKLVPAGEVMDVRGGAFVFETNGDFTWTFDQATAPKPKNLDVFINQDPAFGADAYIEVLFDNKNVPNALISSFIVTIPATIIPITIAAFAAYAFAWMQFPGRDWLFVIVVSLMVVPTQLAFLPILQGFSGIASWATALNQWLTDCELTDSCQVASKSFASLWITHTAFGLPLAIYLLRNYIVGLPKELLQSARIDGASHLQIFTRIIVPLSVPALASFSIFQFLWVWNDLIVALYIGPNNSSDLVFPIRLQKQLGTFKDQLHLLNASAVISMIVPVVVFLSMQRYFIRGLLAGSVKGG
ncbi:carbohydrate ABC transporter permease [Planktomarina temperata]|jgi:alpha-glucoside transport system permease protein|uniref:carbohydrate ABC transporter permease n=2 Tax=Paracoccaceae TaxID=31989 RepID=UPI00014D57D2|nr:carbohydrate ABC transporter permease [Planktomarina temperata]MDA9209200.1 carbohydrate ABC transporter permease [bacterium]MCO4815554.1 carbohydrate ABC transporter permease [Planktomarina temperata]MDA7454905.1 carbohydrate ABC transporter permease [Planktomarina temperata]MDA7460846.1 carbohydrate ABC transporter permease [Planktomarina temperata]